jgi:hypothetical protein
MYERQHVIKIGCPFAGHLITAGVVKPEILISEYGGIARMMWRHLLPVIALRRKMVPLFMVNFEAFCEPT